MNYRVVALVVFVASAVTTGIFVLWRGGEDASPLVTLAPSPAEAYTVHLSPAGDVHFAKTPERVVTMDANYNDMLIALQEAGKIVATGYRDNFHNTFYPQLGGIQPGFSATTIPVLSSAGGGQFDKERLYALHADVHHIDPLQLASMRGWSPADVEEIARNVGPFFANRYSRENSHPGDSPYTYYSLWELSEKVAEVYRKPEVIHALQAIGDRMVANIQAQLPPLPDRPRVGLVFYSNGKFVPYSLTHEGFGQVQYRDLGAQDAFASISDRTYGASGGGPSGSPLDSEGLLALDPDILIMPFALYPGNARENYSQLLQLADDPLLGRLTAFETHRIYPGGTPLQGPLDYLFQLEMAAKQIYPEIFGTFREDLNFPANECLFNRAEVVEALRISPREND
ncbi:ABC-type Fe3+-hydroxamate transport system substrate-binding protein [Haloferula luteola]|uniref:ABC-type Fe3+-hydroxamate transport system substrate-binding protein n=1 Tax=Haloferula luteola TaxID=595692 RepID=A0A840V3L0_9BACT|nr:ABC transporter substrate-binding protein [Haloferula luteola]MBB5352585.1 ABC-type Fe3+-hydroxamate transport system substrate-binding protein [Haloferula luteola]